MTKEAIDIESMLKDLSGGSREDKMRAIPVDMQTTILQEYVAHVKEGHGLQVGDIVTKNSFGEHNVIYPLEGQVGIITAVYDFVHIDDSGRPLNGALSFVGDDKEPVNIGVDLSLYEKVSAAK